MYRDGAKVLSPPAIGLWADTKTAADTLLSGKSDVGFLYEVVATNSVLTMVVTGLETYLEQRFVELDDEGVPADFKSLAKNFLSKEERDRLASGESLALEDEAQALGTTPLRLLMQRINFQNYDRAKTAYNKGYGIKFGELPAPVTSKLLKELQAFIGYRHRIIHVSPLLGHLNASDASPSEPVFANQATARRAISTFDDFVATLHATTLQLRPHH